MADPTTLHELISRHERLVVAMCVRLCEDPEDAAQEVWEKVTGAIARLDLTHATPARAWIATIARRTLVDRHRRRQVRGTQVPTDTLVDPGATPEEQLLAKTGRERLESALRLLPVEQRQVIVLHHIHGVSLATLADEQGVAIGTIKSRLHRGRATLLTLLRSP